MVAYKFTFDKSLCFQCGVCADLCPVNALDYTRARHKNLEDSPGFTNERAEDMTEYPVQVNKCIGCMICPTECPVSCITISQVEAEPEYLPIQGPMKLEEAKDTDFGLMNYTKVRPSKIKTKDVWGKQYVYRPLRRKSATQTLDEKDIIQTQT